MGRSHSFFLTRMKSHSSPTIPRLMILPGMAEVCSSSRRRLPDDIANGCSPFGSIARWLERPDLLRTAAADADAHAGATPFNAVRSSRARRDLQAGLLVLVDVHARVRHDDRRATILPACVTPAGIASVSKHQIRRAMYYPLTLKALFELSRQPGSRALHACWEGNQPDYTQDSSCCSQVRAQGMISSRSNAISSPVSSQMPNFSGVW